MEDIEICNCNNIMKSEIVKAIKEQGLTTVEEVQEATTAGTVCGSCVSDIEDILSEVNG
jgi:NAD(P)H-nitrite reductase large subunit